ncbi:hypothetical protein [Streptomyces sp. NBC_01320]|uniref:hypothetical protein n=1 Tax=Streptomyces sp. NBC_01320 TaxID=2903824 RepID=UPI002E110DB1|nr:hypothetical protein OG395_04760 [Streptomyces sp. NBC_01320]
MGLSEGEGTLFGPEILLGIDAVSKADRDRLVDRLEAVLEARGGLLHANSAFNCLYFGYDSDRLRYTADVDPADFVLVAVGGPAPSLPPGVFVRLTRGTREVWGEVAAAFGSCDGAEPDGWTPAALSGAPPGAGLAEQCLVIDTTVFGALSAEEAVEQGRWQRPGGGFERGQLTGSAAIFAPEVPVQDAIGAYATFLGGPGRSLLDSGPLCDWLGGRSEPESVARAVRAAVTCVADIMADSRTLRCWSFYSRSTRRYEEFASGALAAEIRAVVARPAPGGGARYTALWPLLNALAGVDDSGQDVLAGVPGAALLTDANLVLAETATTDQPPASTDLRIDDQWQQGGIWRAQSHPLPEFLQGLDPLNPAGLGFSKTHSRGTRDRARTPSNPARSSSRVDVQHLDDELVVLTIALSKDDLSAGRLELTKPVKQLLPAGPLVIRLHHDDAEEPSAEVEQQVTPTPSGVAGVRWPASMYPGIRVTVAAARAGRRLVATTVCLPEPLTVPDFGPVRWECDWELFSFRPGAEPWRDALHGSSEEWPATVARSSWRPAVACLEQLIIASLKQDGEPGPADSRALDGRRLTASLFGADIRSPALLWTVIHTCEDMAVLGLLTRAPCPRHGPDIFTWWPDPFEASRILAPGVWGGSGMTEASVPRHWVRPRERRLPTGHQASPQAKSDYARWRVEIEGTEADTELPAGTTFVHGHLRGTGAGKPWHRHLPQ